MTDHIKAWQCIGCGAIEAPQTCIGVCQHRKVQFVYADDHERAMATLRARNEALQALLRRFASIHPREGQHEATLRSFQQQARAILAASEVTDPELDIQAA